MRRYLVVRKWGELETEELPDLQRRLRTAGEDVADVGWEHSHVVRTASGEVLSYCIHTAADEESVRRHADRVGGHAVARVMELGEDARPSDFVEATDEVQR